MDSCNYYQVIMWLEGTVKEQPKNNEVVINQARNAEAWLCQKDVIVHSYYRSLVFEHITYICKM